MSDYTYKEPFIMLAMLARWILLAVVTGLVVGTATSLFLHILAFLIGARTETPLWILAIILPIGGLANGLLIYYGYEKVKEKRSDSVITSIHKQGGQMPYSALFFRPVAALITLASGGSAGKTGPCSQMGAIIASWLGNRFGLREQLQKQIVVSGMAAGFAGVFGIPIAAAFYGVEVISSGKLRYEYIFPAVVASIASVEVSKVWHVPFHFFPIEQSYRLNEDIAWKVLTIGIVCGLVAWIFIEVFEEIGMLFEYLKHRFHIWQPLMPMIGGTVLALLILLIPTDYFSLGMPMLQDTLQGEQAKFYEPFIKILLVAITLGSGFYGGVVTPLFIIGALSGSSLAQLFGIHPAFGAAIGLVAGVASASNAPIAAAFMGLELFSGINAIYAVTSSMAAYIVIGHRSVHPDQIVTHPKSFLVYKENSVPGGRGTGRITYKALRKMRKQESARRAWKRFVPHFHHQSGQLSKKRE
ncbi:chloride channel protein [Aciduricibacillus chroicocephali]|uniref:Chloride channel protein n=1 Tax=Aciduricibacillus chroicocephali TaxID=3054939 RepID=A0ABY9KVV5_9BACI|nr:chloride channel protein [Bacillaceae bacterium 44XB]